MRIDVALKEYEARCRGVLGLSNETIKTKAHIYRRFFEWADIKTVRQLDTNHINGWLEYMAATGVKLNTVRMYGAHLLVLVRYFSDMGYKHKVQTPKVMLPKKHGYDPRIYFSYEEIKDVIAGAEDQAALMIAIAFDTGMRLAALSNLRVSNFTGRMVVYFDKGNKRRESYISIATEKLLINFIAKYSITDHLWGTMTHGVGCSKSTVRRLITAAFMDRARALSVRGGDQGLIARLMQFHPHTLRHSFATDLQRRGASTAETQQLLGHESIRTTEKYLHGFDGRLKELFDKFRSVDSSQDWLDGNTAS